MSILHINQIKNFIGNLFNGKIDMSDIGGYSSKNEIQFLSRALAGYAACMLSKSTPDAIAPFIIDGGDDNGIDCVYYDDSDKILYLIQSKWIQDGIGEPSQGDVSKFTDGIRDLFNYKFNRFNNKLQSLSQPLVQEIEDPYTRCNVVLIYTGLNGLAVHAQRCLDDLKEEMNDAGDLVKVTVIKQDQIHSSLTETFRSEPIDSILGLKYWGKVDEPKRAFYGQINGSTISELWNIYGDRLFENNLRNMLGETDVNDEIRSTVINSPELFWYYNNGITLVADTIIKTMAGGGDNDFGTFHCKNICFVNGAQTVSTIGKYGQHDPDAVKKLNINCRMIEIGNEATSFKGEITRTNNRQNRIENRDFVTLDPEQIRIRKEILVEGFNYNLLRSENYIKTEKSFDLVESTTALACISMKPALFVQLKREIGKLWEDISKAPYKELFNQTTNSVYLIRAVLLQREIEKQLEIIHNMDIIGKKKAVLIHGNRMISALAFTKLPCKRFADPTFNIEDIRPLISIELLDGYLEKVTAKIEDKFSNAIVPTLFKNLSKCTQIFSEIIDEDQQN